MDHANCRIIRAFVRASLLSTAIAGFACQPLFGIERRDEDPVHEGCSLPTVDAGKAILRVGNLVPSDEKVDICVRTSGGDYGRPLIRDGGKACPMGLAYAQLTAPFGVAAGNIDLKIIASGATCSAPARSEIRNVKTKAGEETTIARMGPPAREELRAYPAGAPRTGDKLRLRVIHTVASGPAYDFGVTDGAVLPAELKAPLFEGGLSYGESTVATTKTVIGTLDPNGFIETPGANINVAAALSGTKKALMIAPLSGSGGSRTIFAIGDPTQPFFPVRALQCSDRDLAGATPAEKVLTSCVPSQLGTLSIDSFNAQLYGPSADYELERSGKIFEALGKRDSDMMCIVELSRLDHREKAIAATKATFPYTLTATTDLDTPPTDPRDVRPPSDHPACGGTNDPAVAEAAIKCMQAKCSTTGTEDGKLAGGTSCISERCAAEFIPLLGGDRDRKRCFDCLIVTADSDETHAATRSYCTVSPQDYYSFRGQTPSVLFSKYPIRKSDTLILPSTIYRRVVYYANLEIEAGKFLDYYCAQLIGSYGTTLPYYGQYGNVEGSDPWEEEELLEVQRLVEFVKKNSGDNPAILSGDWSASKAYTAMDGTQLVTAKNEKVILELEKNFALAVPRNHTPHCTECPTDENPYNGTTKKAWQLKAFLHKFPAANPAEAGAINTTEAGNIFTERVVPLPGGGVGPLSDRFGFNVHILRP